MKKMTTKSKNSAIELLKKINNVQRRRLYLEDFYYSYKCSQNDSAQNRNDSSDNCDETKPKKEQDDIKPHIEVLQPKSTK